MIKNIILTIILLFNNLQAEIDYINTDNKPPYVVEKTKTTWVIPGKKTKLYLGGVDPEGDVLTFLIKDKSKLGKLNAYIQHGNELIIDASQYQDEQKDFKELTYVAVDEKGLESKEAYKVEIYIQKEYKMTLHEGEEVQEFNARSWYAGQKNRMDKNTANQFLNKANAAKYFQEGHAKKMFQQEIEAIHSVEESKNYEDLGNNSDLTKTTLRNRTSSTGKESTLLKPVPENNLNPIEDTDDKCFTVDISGKTILDPDYFSGQKNMALSCSQAAGQMEKICSIRRGEAATSQFYVCSSPSVEPNFPDNLSKATLFAAIPGKEEFAKQSCEDACIERGKCSENPADPITIIRNKSFIDAEQAAVIETDFNNLPYIKYFSLEKRTPGNIMAPGYPIKINLLNSALTGGDFHWTNNGKKVTEHVVYSHAGEEIKFVTKVLEDDIVVTKGDKGENSKLVMPKRQFYIVVKKNGNTYSTNDKNYLWSIVVDANKPVYKCELKGFPNGQNAHSSKESCEQTCYISNECVPYNTLKMDGIDDIENYCADAVPSLGNISLEEATKQGYCKIKNEYIVDKNGQKSHYFIKNFQQIDPFLPDIEGKKINSFEFLKNERAQGMASSFMNMINSSNQLNHTFPLGSNRFIDFNDNFNSSKLVTFPYLKGESDVNRDLSLLIKPNPKIVNEINSKEVNLIDYVRTIPVEKSYQKRCPDNSYFDKKTNLCYPVGTSSLGDFSKWSQGGNPTAGNWTITDNNTKITQTINGAPTYYLSNKEYNELTFSGTIEVSSKLDTDNDDDWIGFVFGYKNSNDFFLFDWKQKKQDDSNFGGFPGFKLVKVTGPIPFKQQVDNIPGFKVLKTNYGSDKGWKKDKPYNIEITYDKRHFTAKVDGEIVLTYTAPEDTFGKGKIGFYNFSQKGVIYSNFNMAAMDCSLIGAGGYTVSEDGKSCVRSDCIDDTWTKEGDVCKKTMKVNGNLETPPIECPIGTSYKYGGCMADKEDSACPTDGIYQASKDKCLIPENTKMKKIEVSSILKNSKGEIIDRTDKTFEVAEDADIQIQAYHDIDFSENGNCIKNNMGEIFILDTATTDTYASGILINRPAQTCEIGNDKIKKLPNDGTVYLSTGMGKRELSISATSTTYVNTDNYKYVDPICTNIGSIRIGGKCAHAIASYKHKTETDAIKREVDCTEAGSVPLSNGKCAIYSCPKDSYPLKGDPSKCYIERCEAPYVLEKNPNSGRCVIPNDFTNEKYGVAVFLVEADIPKSYGSQIGHSSGRPTILNKSSMEIKYLLPNGAFAVPYKESGTGIYLMDKLSFQEKPKDYKEDWMGTSPNQKLQDLGLSWRGEFFEDDKNAYKELSILKNFKLYNKENTRLYVFTGRAIDLQKEKIKDLINQIKEEALDKNKEHLMWDFKNKSSIIYQNLPAKLQKVNGKYVKTKTGNIKDIGKSADGIRKAKSLFSNNFDIYDYFDDEAPTRTDNINIGRRGVNENMAIEASLATKEKEGNGYYFIYMAKDDKGIGSDTWFLTPAQTEARYGCHYSKYTCSIDGEKYGTFSSKASCSDLCIKRPKPTITTKNNTPVNWSMNILGTTNDIETGSTVLDNQSISIPMSKMNALNLKCINQIGNTCQSTINTLENIIPLGKTTKAAPYGIQLVNQKNIDLPYVGVTDKLNKEEPKLNCMNAEKHYKISLVYKPLGFDNWESVKDKNIPANTPIALKIDFPAYNNYCAIGISGENVKIKANPCSNNAVLINNKCVSTNNDYPYRKETKGTCIAENPSDIGTDKTLSRIFPSFDVCQNSCKKNEDNDIKLQSINSRIAYKGSPYNIKSEISVIRTDGQNSKELGGQISSYFNEDGTLNSYVLGDDNKGIVINGFQKDEKVIITYRPINVGTKSVIAFAHWDRDLIEKSKSSLNGVERIIGKNGYTCYNIKSERPGDGLSFLIDKNTDGKFEQAINLTDPFYCEKEGINDNTIIKQEIDFKNDELIYTTVNQGLEVSTEKELKYTNISHGDCLEEKLDEDSVGVPKWEGLLPDGALKKEAGKNIGIYEYDYENHKDSDKMITMKGPLLGDNKEYNVQGFKVDTSNLGTDTSNIVKNIGAATPGLSTNIEGISNILKNNNIPIAFERGVVSTDKFKAYMKNMNLSYFAENGYKIFAGYGFENWQDCREFKTIEFETTTKTETPKQDIIKRCPEGTVYDTSSQVCVEIGTGLGDFSKWTPAGTRCVEGSTGCRNANWILSADKRKITQTTNTSAGSYYLSPNTYDSITFKGKIKVATTSDDDWIGFVFGYANSHDYFLLDWKQAEQAGAPEGLTLAKVTGEVPWARNANTQNNGFKVLKIKAGQNEGWKDNTEYDIKITYTKKTFELYINNELKLSYKSSVDIFHSGKIGFYNFSQDHVEYYDFRTEATDCTKLTDYQLSDDGSECVKTWCEDSEFTLENGICSLDVIKEKTVEKTFCKPWWEIRREYDCSNYQREEKFTDRFIQGYPRWIEINKKVRKEKAALTTDKDGNIVELSE